MPPMRQMTEHPDCFSSDVEPSVKARRFVFGRRAGNIWIRSKYKLWVGDIVSDSINDVLESRCQGRATYWKAGHKRE